MGSKSSERKRHSGAPFSQIRGDQQLSTTEMVSLLLARADEAARIFEDNSCKSERRNWKVASSGTNGCRCTDRP
jgi:hypothetical protein